MARIRKCRVNASIHPHDIYIICYDVNEIVYWDKAQEEWVDGQTSSKKGHGKYHRMYAAGELCTPLQFMIDTGGVVPRELQVKAG